MAVMDQAITERYAIYLGDCIEVMKKLKKESIHLSLYSPPLVDFIIIHHPTAIFPTAGIIRNFSSTTNLSSAIFSGSPCRGG